MINFKNSKHNQSGMASLVIISVLIVLLTLITVGFSRLMDRSVNNALNNQLSAAASYAAQSGVNDAVKYIKDQQVANPGTPVSSNTCNSTVLTQALASQANISGDGNTKITCLLINPSPPDVNYSQINPHTSQVAKLTSSAPIDRLMVSWQSSDRNKNGFPPSLSFDSITNWNYTPVLRMALYAVPSDGNANNITSKTFFLFLQSSSASFTTIAFNATSDGSIVKVNCGNKSQGSFVGTPDLDCNTIITQLASALSPAPKYFYARFTPVYNQADIKLKANDGSGSGVTFQNVQTVIDVTSKSGNAVKRLQERIDTDTSGSTYNTSTAQIAPEDALRSAASLCKRLTETTSPTNTVIDGSQCGTVVTNPPPPTPLTGGHGSITYNSASVSGTVNPNGYPVTDCRFVYSTSSNLSASTPNYAGCNINPGSGNSPVGVSANLTGLNNSTTYYYALCAANDYNAEVCDTSNLSGGGSNFTTPTPPPVANISYNGPAGGTSNPNFILSLNFSCTYSSSATLNLSSGQHGGGPIAIQANSTSNPNYWAGGPYQYGDSGTATVTCSGGGGTTTSAPTSWTFNWPEVYVHIDNPATNGTAGFSTVINRVYATRQVQVENDCRDGNHNFVTCISFHANQGGDPTLISSCTVTVNGSNIQNLGNGRGVTHWSSQGTWIDDSLGYNASPYYTPPNYYPYPNGSSVSVTCYGQGGKSSTSDNSFNASWPTCAERGQIGIYYSDVSGNGCSNPPPPPPPPPPPGPVNVGAGSSCNSRNNKNQCTSTNVSYSASQSNGGIVRGHQQWPANRGSGGSSDVSAPSGSFNINGIHTGNNDLITCWGANGASGSATAPLR